MVRPEDPPKKPQTDEALSSWISRRLGQLGLAKETFQNVLMHDYPDVANSLEIDPDFPQGGHWRGVLARLLKVTPSSLERIGNTCSPWILKPGCRRTVCLDCLADAPSPSEQYKREIWTHSWRTTCDIHFTPLVRTPAVGWEWAELRYASRKLHGRLMRLPGVFAERNRDSWLSVQSFLREAVFSAERYLMSDWSEHLAHAKSADLTGAMIVWSDLLSCVSRSWQPMTAPMIASFGLPVILNRSTHFRTPNVEPQRAAPDMSKFCSTEDPSARRTCMVVAVDAMYDVSQFPVIGMKRQPLPWGWPKLVQEMPFEALSWLMKRAQQWPNVWKAKAELWGHLRD